MLKEQQCAFCYQEWLKWIIVGQLNEWPRDADTEFQINFDQPPKHQCLAKMEWSLNQTPTNLEHKVCASCQKSIKLTIASGVSFIILMKQANL